ncbi:MAG: hypothetical protein E7503_03990 [Ruminococcus sp.]|nr:hypothetical protein [Ruminococcus sp.]
MKPLSMILSAAMLLSSVASLPVTAAENNDMILFPIYPSVQYTESICKIQSETDLDFKLTVYQHSEEREALVMYQAKQTSGTATNYSCVQLEPGDYTLKITMPAVIGCPTVLTQTVPFTVADPDFIGEYSKTEVTVTLTAALSEDAPAFTQTDTASFVENGVQYISATLCCTCGEALRGDTDLNGIINSTDAIWALQQYAASLTQMPAPLTEIQRICADIDGDGIVQLTDAIGILQYYNGSLMEDAPSWEEIIGNHS